MRFGRAVPIDRKLGAGADILLAFICDPALTLSQLTPRLAFSNFLALEALVVGGDEVGGFFKRAYPHPDGGLRPRGPGSDNA